MSRRILLATFFVMGLGVSNSALSQETTVVLSTGMFDAEQVIFLGNLDGWVFRPGHDPAWADPDLDTSDWEKLRPSDLTMDLADGSGLFEGWFRFRFQLDSTFTGMPLGWRSGTFGAMALYLDGEKVQSFGTPDADRRRHISYNPLNRIPDPADLEVGREYVLAFHLVDHQSALVDRFTLRSLRLDPWLRLTGPEYDQLIQTLRKTAANFHIVWITALFLLTFLFWVISYQSRREYMLRLIAWMNSLFLITVFSLHLQSSAIITELVQIELVQLAFMVSIHMIIGLVPMVISQMLRNAISRRLKVLFWVFVLVGILTHQTEHIGLTILGLLLISGIIIRYIRDAWGRILTSQWMVIGGLALNILSLLMLLLLDLVTVVPNFMAQQILMTAIYLTLPISLLLFISMRYREILVEIQENANEVVRLTNEKLEAEREKQVIAANQKIVLEQEVAKRTQELRESLENLRATQEQLVQQEKLASLGQLTAGIAHEIKNPLNFVNNFSDVSLEIISEVMDAVSKLEPNEVTKEMASSLADITSNLRKIHEHGSRADGIVKSMLMHSRGGSGKMEPTDLNALVREYVNLAFHGMRAGKNPIEVDIELQLDESVGEVPLIAEDFSRVILNLCTNAFDACSERSRSPVSFDSPLQSSGGSIQGPPQSDSPRRVSPWKPRLTIRTAKTKGTITIEVEDNGPGIPDEIKDKILQPFFTTKKGTQGTGLGLSITHDIVKAHGGVMEINSATGEGAAFIITLKIN